MLNPPKKLCKECKKNPPHTGRKICISCITRISKEKAREAKAKQKEKLKVKKQLAKTKKAFSRSALVKECDRVASLYVRERDRGKPCVTCGALWEDNHQN